MAVGSLLSKGETLQGNDIYASSDGEWRQCPTPGIALDDTDTIWLRPVALIEDEWRLLFTLASQAKDRFDCIARTSERFVLVPNVKYNWDNRIETPTVDNVSGLQKLLDLGFLSETKDLGSNGGIVFYTLTDTGRIAAHQLADQMTAALEAMAALDALP